MHSVEASWDWVGLVFSYFGHPFIKCLGAQSLSIVSIIYKAEGAIIGLGTFAVGPHIIQSLYQEDTVTFTVVLIGGRT